MRSKQFLHLMARTLIAALLFAQGALALAACDWARRVPAQAIAPGAILADGERCEMQARSINLCVAHCLAEDQSSDKPSLSLPTIADVPFLVAHRVTPRPAHAARAAEPLRRAAGPPIHIRFQSLLL